MNNSGMSQHGEVGQASSPPRGLNSVRAKLGALNEPAENIRFVTEEGMEAMLQFTPWLDPGKQSKVLFPVINSGLDEKSAAKISPYFSKLDKGLRGMLLYKATIKLPAEWSSNFIAQHYRGTWDKNERNGLVEFLHRKNDPKSMISVIEAAEAKLSLNARSAFSLDERIRQDRPTSIAD